MFGGAYSANPDVTNWNLSNVRDIALMFHSTSANPDVSNWDVSNVTDMNSMFMSAPSADPDVSNWDVSNVTDLNNMFADAYAANPDVSNWDVSKVTSFAAMFMSATSADPDTSNWNIRSVEGWAFDNMFSGATAFSQQNVDNFLKMLYLNRFNVDCRWRLILHIDLSESASPSGTYEDEDPPTTGKGYIYELTNDPENEGFCKWSFDYNN